VLASAWVEKLKIWSFDHSISGYLGSSKTNDLEFLLKKMPYLRKLETHGLSTYESQSQNAEKSFLLADSSKGQVHAFYSIGSMHLFTKEMRQYNRNKFEKRWEVDEVIECTLRKLLYKSVPRITYDAIAEYGLTEKTTIGAKLSCAYFQSAFLNNPFAFTFHANWKRQLGDFSPYVVSIMPYAEISYCKVCTKGIGMDLLVGHGRPCHRKIGKVQFSKTFGNHSIGIYIPDSESRVDLKVENTRGKELNSGVGFYFQQFWTHSFPRQKGVAHFASHRVQIALYKKVGEFEVRLAIFAEYSHSRQAYKNYRKRFSTYSYAGGNENYQEHQHTSTQKIRGLYNEIGNKFCDKTIFKTINKGISLNLAWKF